MIVFDFPHSDIYKLHAPGVCVSCDRYPTAQSLRRAWNVPFSHPETNTIYINGRAYSFSRLTISYDDIVKLSCETEKTVLLCFESPGSPFVPWVVDPNSSVSVVDGRRFQTVAVAKCDTLHLYDGERLS